jgi:hypothetical protein
MQPNANIPIIQNHVLLKLNPLNHFLVQRNYEAAVELRLNYLHIMSNYYYSRFGKYVQKMQKLQSVVADKYDLLGLDESARKGFFGTVTKIVPLKDRTSVFSLGDRIQSLVNIDAPVILSHVAEEKQEKYPFEAIFRSVVRTLMDNSSSEYCFASEFFYASRGKKGEESAASGISI